MLCQFCYSDIAPDSIFCAFCGERQTHAIAEEVIEGEADHLPHDYSDRTRFFVITFGIAAAIFLFASWRQNHEDGIRPNASGPSSVGQVDEGEAGFHCERALKRRLASSESYKGRGPWTISADDGQVTVTRDYSATNGFGARLDSTYYCRYDPTLRRVTSLITGQ